MTKPDFKTQLQQEIEKNQGYNKGKERAELETPEKAKRQRKGLNYRLYLCYKRTATAWRTLVILNMLG